MLSWDPEQSVFNGARTRKEDSIIFVIVREAFLVYDPQSVDTANRGTVVLEVRAGEFSYWKIGGNWEPETSAAFLGRVQSGTCSLSHPSQRGPEKTLSSTKALNYLSQIWIVGAWSKLLKIWAVAGQRFQSLWNAADCWADWIFCLVGGSSWLDGEKCQKWASPEHQKKVKERRRESQTGLRWTFPLH